MNKIKLCKGCRHAATISVAIPGGYGKTIVCERDMRAEVRIDLVTGEKIITRSNDPSCWLERGDKGECGKGGLYFTPHKSLWQKLKGWLS